MSMHTAGDIPLQITSENSSSERRITPSWTIGQLKAKLEPITGIPPLSQKLILRLGSQQSVPLEAVDEENTQLGVFPLAPYAEIHVSFEFTDVRFAKQSCDTLLHCTSGRPYPAIRCSEVCKKQRRRVLAITMSMTLTIFGSCCDI
jgi:hypothetical protein